MNREGRTARLHLVTGPWGSGKSSILPALASLLPDHVVLDWDLVIPGISVAAGKDVHSDPSTWAGLQETWEALIETLLRSGHNVVLCGPATPDQLDDGRLGTSSIRCAYLDCPDDLLTQRLHERGASDEAVADELAVSRALRGSGYAAIAVAGKSPREVAEEVTRWVRSSG